MNAYANRNIFDIYKKNLRKLLCFIFVVFIWFIGSFYLYSELSKKPIQKIINICKYFYENIRKLLCKFCHTKKV